ncbi:GNAT family N-acetyltransferase [Metasolibacillus fluoroglycofenilyticus]|uniref:GNAT family N-acetyltransferase n=1 Tax=Metasolibacillus fluoroglycofenilyticus TaxID=1239396 RepID=UPI000D34EC9E|nr:GNAT family N-acetyltransferase [Metasolibacillus fluoroglycofenilyticus]
MFQTARCIIKKLTKEDLADIQHLYQQHEVRKYLGGVVVPSIVKENVEILLTTPDAGYHLVARELGSQQFIGLVSLDLYHDGQSIELSYQLSPTWWGDGYATEILQVVLQFAFKELQLPYVVAETQTANIASCKLLERLGMTVKEKVERFGAKQAIYSLENPNSKKL